jgi:hypothetical protein
MERLVLGAWVVTGPAACDDPNQPAAPSVAPLGTQPDHEPVPGHPLLSGPASNASKARRRALLHHAPPVRLDQGRCYPTSMCGIHCARVAAQSRKPNPPLSP